MFGFYYIYKGPKQSLIARYDAILFMTHRLVSERAEEEILSVGQLYKNGTKFTEKPNHISGTTFKRIVGPEDLNSKGALAIEEAKKELMAHAFYYAAKIDTDGAVYIKDITKPKYWYERLTVRASVESRAIYIQSLSVQEGYPLAEWEKSTEDQVRYLLTLRVLPHYFDWVKTMKVFKDIYPKPTWWEQEYRHYKQLVEGK